MQELGLNIRRLFAVPQDEIKDALDTDAQVFVHNQLLLQPLSRSAQQGLEQIVGALMLCSAYSSSSLLRSCTLAPAMVLKVLL